MKPTDEQVRIFYQDVKEMRELQKLYFKTHPRDMELLKASKAQEKKVDALIEEYFKPNNQTSLF